MGEQKVRSAAEALHSLNPSITVHDVAERLNWDNALRLMADVDVVIDGTDNFATRHIVSAACARAGIPHVWASVLGFDAQLSVFWAGKGPVYEDIFPEPPAPGSIPNCAQAGVLGPLVGIIGSAMAMETIKLLTDLGTTSAGDRWLLRLTRFTLGLHSHPRGPGDHSAPPRRWTRDSRTPRHNNVI